MTQPQQPSELEQERLRLKAEIDQNTADAKDVDPDGTASEKALRASKRLEKLNDDYRALIIAMKPTAPAAAPQTPAPPGTTRITRPDGSIIDADAQGNQTTIAGPMATPLAPTRPASDPSTWTPIRANPADPQSRIIALQDPSDASNKVTVPQDANAQKPSIVDGVRGQKFVWDGTSLKELIKPEADKRQIVQGAGGAIYAYDGTTLTPLQAGTYQAKNGDTMQDVDAKGNKVTKTFQNGQWGVTSVGESVLPGAAKEGATRNRIQNGFNTTETYQNGEWITTSMGTRAQPGTSTQLTAPADQANLVTMQDGTTTTQANPNYQPKTQAQIAARIGQIQSLAAAKQAEVQGKVGKNGYTADNALADFNGWWDKNVAPEQASLAAAQDDAAFTRAKDAAAMRSSAMTSALGAGSQEVSAFGAMQKDRVGPNFEAASAAASRGDFGALANVQNATSYKAPDIMQLAREGTNNALKYIDPTAAAATGSPPPNYQAMNPAAMLDRTRYQPSGMPPPPTTAPVAAGGGAPADAAAPGPDWVATMARLNADKAEQARQARVQVAPNPFPSWSAAQGMGQAPGGAGQPATGDIAGSIQMPDWLRNGTPPPGAIGGAPPGMTPGLGTVNPWDYLRYQPQPFQ